MLVNHHRSRALEEASVITRLLNENRNNSTCIDGRLPEETIQHERYSEGRSKLVLSCKSVAIRNTGQYFPGDATTGSRVPTCRACLSILAQFDDNHSCLSPLAPVRYALSTLWSTFRVEDDRVHLASECLQRSQQAPLRVYCHQTNEIWGDLSFPDFYSSLESQSHRFLEFHIFIKGYNNPIFLQTIFKHPAPAIEALSRGFAKYG